MLHDIVKSHKCIYLFDEAISELDVHALFVGARADVILVAELDSLLTVPEMQRVSAWQTMSLSATCL